MQRLRGGKRPIPATPLAARSRAALISFSNPPFPWFCPGIASYSLRNGAWMGMSCVESLPSHRETALQ